MLNKWRSSLLILAATVLYASLPQAVMAATVTWNGGSGLWSAATQWSSGTVPTSADDVVIPASAGDIITLQGSASANSLTVGAASKLVLDAGFSATSLTVGNGVSNDGTIDFNTVQTSPNPASLIVSNGTLTNTITGIIRRSADMGLPQNSSITAVLVNGGTIDIAISRVIILNGASFVNDVSGIIQGAGTLDVSGTTFMNNGIINPSGGAVPIGRLNITGDFPLMSSSVLLSEISGTMTAGADYDQMAVSGTVTLGGTLSVALNGYAPGVGDSFMIISAPAGTVTGTFSAANLPAPGAGLGWNVAYNTTGVVLSVVNAPNITLTPNYVYYGDVHVGLSSSATLTLTNTGSVDLDIFSLSFAGTNPGDFTVTNNCPIAVAPAGSCTLDVTFSPRPLGAGPRDALLEIASNDPANPLLTAYLYGNGVYTLTVVNTDTTGGWITAGCGDGCVISCGLGDATCTGAFLDGSITLVNQAATPGYVFSGWSSPTCPGGGPCAVIMDQDVSLTGGFCNGSFSISPSNAAFNTFFGSSGSLLVTQQTGTSCSWTANGNSPMIAVTSGANSSGNGTVDYAVNGSSDLLDTLTAAGQTFTVTRAGVAGGFDTSFGSPNGFVTYPTGTTGNGITIKGAALQADGMIVVTGYTENAVRGGYDTFVGRYAANGTLDPNFGTGGVVTYVTPTYSNFGNGIAIQSDGKIVVTGYAYDSTTGDDVLVLRLATTGAFDTSFNGTGVVMWNGPSNSAEEGYAVAVDPATGKIVVTGTRYNGTDNDVLILRFNIDGSVDTGSFNAPNGYLTITNAAYDSGNAVAVQTDGRILVTGYLTDASFNSNAFVARYNADGTPDSSFGANSLVTITNPDAAGNAITVQPDGKILVAGYLYTGTDRDAMLLRYNADGTPDVTFNAGGTPGKYLYDDGTNRDAWANALALQTDGTIVVAGSTTGFTGTNDALVVQYKADGTLDTSFGNMGAANYNGIGNYDDYAMAVLAQPDKKIIVAGNTYDTQGRGIVMRLLNFISIGEAVDNMSLPWTTGGNANWLGQTAVSFSGGSAARSGTIADYQDTWVETTVTGPASLSFMWKVSSEFNYDYLELLIDGAPQPGGISGEVDWQQKTFFIPSGAHTVRWSYSKDSSNSSGSDAAWLDQVVVTPYQISVSCVPGTDFGSVLLGSPVTANCTLSNGGTTGITLGAFSLLGDSDFTKTSDNCSGQAIAASGTCPFQISFTPAVGGIRSATLNIPVAGIIGSMPVLFTGTGLAQTLTTSTAGSTGSGAITSSVGGINCGPTLYSCSASLSSGSTVTLTATPDVNSAFTGWSGACAGTGPCVVTMDTDKSVDATFISATTLGGVPQEGNLQVTVYDDGRIGVYRFISGAWQNQVFAGDSKGSRLQLLTNGTTTADFSLGYYSGTPASHVTTTMIGSNQVEGIWTGETGTVPGAGMQITLDLAYQPGDSYYSLKWVLLNQSGGTLTDVRFFHGEDTYFNGDDHGNGFWDALNNTIGVEQTISGQQTRMSLQSVNAPFAYDSEHYGTVAGNVNAGALTNTINPYDPLYPPDNGYALEWRNASMADGAAWTITAYEKFADVAVGTVSVAAPILTDCPAGNACNLAYTVRNMTATDTTVTLGTTIDQAGWGASIVSSPSTTITVPANGSQLVTVRVSVPAGAPFGDVAHATLSANDGTVTAGDIATVRAANPTIVSILATAGPNGTIAPSGTISVPYGAPHAIFTISPGTGFHVADVLIDGASIGPMTTFDFTNVTAGHTISATFAADIAPAFSSVAPPQNAFINTASVGYALNIPIISGSVTFTRTGGAADPTPHVYDFISTDMTAGNHSIDTQLPLVDAAVYTVMFLASDGVNTTSATMNNVTYDTSAALLSIGGPQSNTYMSTAVVSYSLNETVNFGQITITRTGGSPDALSPYTYTLSASDRAAGAHTVNTGAALLNGTIYTVSFENIADLAGNPTAPVASINVTFDNQSVGVGGMKPSSKGIATNGTVSYTLSEDALSGTVTFTRTGGAADGGSPHAYTLGPADLAKGAHTVNTGASLVEEAFYTVTYQFIDKAGNPASTLSNAMVFYDSGYGTRPAWKVFNDGTSVVNDSDVNKMKSYIGTRPGDPEWNPVCDLDHNNTVDPRDLMILMQHYGK